MIKYLSLKYWKRLRDNHLANKRERIRKAKGFHTITGEEVLGGGTYETRDGTKVFINQTTWQNNGRIRGQCPGNPHVTWSWDCNGEWIESHFDLMRRVN